MQRYCVLGLNHRSAGVDLRERFAIPASALPLALTQLREQQGIGQALVLSTCNRVELICWSEADDTRQRLESFMADFHHVSPQVIRDNFYFHVGTDAVEHVFRVACSLDSLVLGEHQILNQLKQAYTVSSEAAASGKALNALMHHAFRAAKLVHGTTGIARGQLSIASVAVTFIRRAFASLHNKHALLIGTGEMGQLTLRHLREAGVGQVTVLNRTLSNASALAEAFGGAAAPLSELERFLPQADVVVSQTAAPNHIVTRAMVEHAMHRRRGHPLFFVDLAVPRDIASDVDEVPDVYRYVVDDLQAVVQESMSQRQAEIAACERVLSEHIAEFTQRFRVYTVEPMIGQIKQRADSVVEAELQRLRARLPQLPPEFASELLEELQEACRRVGNKLVHGAIQVVKDEARREAADAHLLSLVERMYNPESTCRRSEAEKLEPASDSLVSDAEVPATAEQAPSKCPVDHMRSKTSASANHSNTP